MKNQPNRLPADAPHGMGGDLLDRSKPLRFKLNGRWIEGFEGDTVLSAALANGIDTAGRHFDTALALDETSAPLITTWDSGPLPMHATPALDGVDFATLGVRREPLGARGVFGTVGRLLGRSSPSLHHRYGDVPPASEPWRSAKIDEELEAEFAIVGGGVAGMAAAAAASAAGKTAILIERSPTLGGAIRFFGAMEREESPDLTLEKLEQGLDGKQPVNRLLRAEAFDLHGATVKVHQVLAPDGHPRSRVLAITAKTIILATGALERLPVFAGNRTPGVTGSLAAHLRARRYGVWPGKRVIIATPHSNAYRLGLQAADAGLTVQRIVDTRVNPHSRFVDFSKASGITLASGLVTNYATPRRRNEPGLNVGFVVAIEEAEHLAPTIETDQLIAAGSWQPNLQLWLSSGGSAEWDTTNGWFTHHGNSEHITVVGSAAGWRSTTAGIASARAAVLKSLGKPAPGVTDIRIDSIYETPDGPTPIAPRRFSGSSYLDRGTSLLTRRSATPAFAQHPAALSLSDVAAAVQLGAIPTQEAGAVATQRCGVAGEIAASNWTPPPAAGLTDMMPPVPAYLSGRFGARAQLGVITAFDPRVFEVGCLVFATSEIADPLEAIGVIFARAPGGGPGGLALLSARGVPDNTVFVRDSSGAVSSKIIERLKTKA